LPPLDSFKYPPLVFNPEPPLPAVYNTTSLPFLKFVTLVFLPIPCPEFPKYICPLPLPLSPINICGLEDWICNLCVGLVLPKPIPTLPVWSIHILEWLKVTASADVLPPSDKQKFNLLLEWSPCPSAIIAHLLRVGALECGVPKYIDASLFSSWAVLITKLPPYISNFSVGVVVPIPTLPPSFINKTDCPSSCMSIILLPPSWFTINAGPVPEFWTLNWSVTCTCVIILLKPPLINISPLTLKLFLIKTLPSMSNFSVGCIPTPTLVLCEYIFLLTILVSTLASV